MNTPQYKIGDKVWKIAPWGKAKEYTILGIIQAEDVHLRKSVIVNNEDDMGYVNIYYQLEMMDNHKVESNNITLDMFVDEYSLFSSKEELIESL